MIQIDISASHWQEFDMEIDGEIFIFDIVFNDLDNRFYISFSKYDNDGNIHVLQGYTLISTNNLILTSWASTKGNFIVVATNNSVQEPTTVEAFNTDFAFLYLTNEEIDGFKNL